MGTLGGSPNPPAKGSERQSRSSPTRPVPQTPVALGPGFLARVEGAPELRAGGSPSPLRLPRHSVRSTLPARVTGSPLAPAVGNGPARWILRSVHHLARSPRQVRIFCWDSASFQLSPVCPWAAHGAERTDRVERGRGLGEGLQGRERLLRRSPAGCQGATEVAMDGEAIRRRPSPATLSPAPGRPASGESAASNRTRLREASTRGV